MDIDDIIAGGGIMFRPARKEDNGNGKVKTKAKKKKYITGAHGSGSARQKQNTANNVPTDTKGNKETMALSNRARNTDIRKQTQAICLHTI